MKRKIIDKVKLLAIWAAIVLVVGLCSCKGAAGEEPAKEQGTADGGVAKEQTAGGEATKEYAVGEVGADSGAEKEKTVYEYGESLMEHDKEEVVYALARADGTPYEITVRTSLKCPGESDTISDYTFLTDIKNKEGDESYTLESDGRLIWENHGSDIQYEGVSDRELPVLVKISYYLDGREVSAEELAGASGRIKIRFDYRNNTGTGDDMIPFMAISGMVLPGDKVSDIELTGGKKRKMDEDILVVQSVMPGMDVYLEEEEGKPDKESGEESDFPQYWEVSFDAVDFALDFTATVIVNGLLEETDLTELFDMTENMQEGYGKMDDGTDELEEALKELSGRSAQLVAGAESLQSGLDELNMAISMLPQDDPAVKQLKAAAEALSSGSAQLTTGVKGYTGGVDKIYEGMTKMSEGVDDMTDSGNEMADAAEKIKNLQDSDKTYYNYGGIPEEKSGSVIFIVETDEICADEMTKSDY